MYDCMCTSVGSEVVIHNYFCCIIEKQFISLIKMYFDFRSTLQFPMGCSFSDCIGWVEVWNSFLCIAFVSICCMLRQSPFWSRLVRRWDVLESIQAFCQLVWNLLSYRKKRCICFLKFSSFWIILDLSLDQFRLGWYHCLVSCPQLLKRRS